MKPIALSSAAAVALIVNTVVTYCANAQTTAADPHHGHGTSSQVAPDSRPSQTTQPGNPGMTSPGMMGQGMMGRMMQPA